MIDFSTYIAISELIMDLPTRNKDAEEEEIVLIKALLSGKSREHSWSSRLQHFLNQSEILAGASVSGGEPTDEQLLQDLLDACDENSLDVLLSEYGESSRLGQMILKSRRRQPVPEDALKREALSEYDEGQKSFYELLKEEMNKKHYKNDAEFYNKIQFSRKIFSKMRLQKDYVLSKDSVLWLTAGLELDYWSTLRLLQAQGYTFRPRSRRDSIIVYVLKNGNYTLDQLNELLYFFDERILGDPRSRSD